MDRPFAGGGPARTDLVAGIEEEVGFLEASGSSLFVCQHRPLGPVTGAVVICPALFVDQLRNYRAEVSLARRLAASGVLVQRFHYRGTGHSDGSGTEITFDTLCEDAVKAIAVARDAAPLEPLAVLGTRFGALVAAEACALAERVVGLALWEPVLDPRRFFREGIRAARMRAVSRGATGEEGSAGGTLQQLEQQGSLDILGFTIDRGLVDSSTGRSIENGAASVRDVLIVQLTGDEESPDTTRLGDSLRNHGCVVDVRVVPQAGGGGPWWLLDDRLQGMAQPPFQPQVELTAGWLKAVLDREGVSA